MALHIKIAAVGGIREKFYKDAIAEYQKRISRYATLTIEEVPDQKAPERLSAAQQQAVLMQEGQRLLKILPPRAYCIALYIGGTRMDSLEFSDYLSSLAQNSPGGVCFILGGSLGLSAGVLERADAKLSLSDMTFCHPLARVALLEQIYRACRIQANAPYHK